MKEYVRAFRYEIVSNFALSHHSGIEIASGFREGRVFVVFVVAGTTTEQPRPASA